jgi:hypothetical protein
MVASAHQGHASRTARPIKQAVGGTTPAFAVALCSQEEANHENVEPLQPRQVSWQGLEAQQGNCDADRIHHDNLREWAKDMAMFLLSGMDLHVNCATYCSSQRLLSFRLNADTSAARTVAELRSLKAFFATCRTMPSQRQH